MSSAESSVAAIVVTYNRCELLRRWMCAIQRQRRPVQEIIVVDNASEDDTASLLSHEFPEVTHLRMRENLGPAGGWAVGMEAAYQRGHQWLWIFGDDSFAEPTVLERCLKAYRFLDRNTGIICPVTRGDGTAFYGIQWHGRPLPVRPHLSGNPVHVDGVTFAGALISREVVERVGYPRSDFFFMFEEYDYCLRARAAGFTITTLPDVVTEHLNAGSTEYSAPWRGYYQTRNHLAMVLERGSLHDLFWWGVRQSRFVAGIVLHLDSKRERLRLRALGAWHGLRGQMGRTIDPSATTTKQGTSN